MDLSKGFTDVAASYTMTVLHDHGFNRTLRFTRPKHLNEYWFELNTAPGSLTFLGDGEAYVFAHNHEKDMFRIFRSGVRKDGSLQIDPAHWSTKLASNGESVSVYSKQVFEQLAAEELADGEKDFPGVTEAWTKHVEDYYTDSESDALEALSAFSFGAVNRVSCICGEHVDVERDGLVPLKFTSKHRGSGHRRSIRAVDGFEFPDNSDLDLTEFTPWYLFACSAIVWGISRYDASKRPGPVLELPNPAAAKAVA